MRRDPEFPARWANLKYRRPPRGPVLGILYMVGGLLGYLVVLFPLSDATPTAVALTVSSCGILGGLVVLFARKPVSNGVIYLYSVVAIVMLSFLIANATTQLGIAVAALPYIWFCVYFGAYLEPLPARIQVFLICVCFGIALIVSDVAASVSLWVLYSGTIIVTMESLLATGQALREQARRDPLTGLLNRRGLEEAAGTVLAIGKRIGKPTAVAMIDLDGFKEVNDTEGHSAGDQILRDVAAAWTKQQRDADLVSRLGGDEFVIVMSATDLEEAESLIDRYRIAHPIGWSCGIVEVREGESLPAAIDRADGVLYAAKPGRGDA